jgi:hypothetical protein
MAPYCVWRPLLSKSHRKSHNIVVFSRQPFPSGTGLRYSHWYQVLTYLYVKVS